MKKLKYYLTEYEVYDSTTDETLTFSGPTIVASSFREARKEIREHFNTAFRDYKIINA